MEYVTVEPPQIKTQADVTALALLQLCRYDFLAAPILVKPGKAADHAYAVEVFRLSSTTSSVESLLLRVECTAVGIVSIQEGKTVNTNQELQRRDIYTAMVSATILLKSMDILPDSFQINIHERNSNEIVVRFIGIPLAPGRFSTVVVGSKSIRYYPGK